MTLLSGSVNPVAIVPLRDDYAELTRPACQKGENARVSLRG
jgi:hypothetical protein